MQADSVFILKPTTAVPYFIQFFSHTRPPSRVHKPSKHFNEKNYRPSRARKCFRRSQTAQFEIKAHFFDVLSGLDDGAAFGATGAGLGFVSSWETATIASAC